MPWAVVLVIGGVGQGPAGPHMEALGPSWPAATPAAEKHQDLAAEEMPADPSFKLKT